MREPSALFASLGMAIFNGSIMVALYFNTFYPSPVIGQPITEAQYRETLTLQGSNSVGFLFMTILQIFLAHSYSTMLTFQIEKPVFVREYSSRLYSLSIYFYTKMLFELPMIIIAPMVQLLIVYWGVGCLPGILPFMNTYLVILVLALSAAGLGLLVGSISGSATESPALATALTFPMILFCGLVRNLSTMPGWYGWLQYLSPPRFALNGLLIAQWSDSQIFTAVYTNVLGFGNFTLYECVYSILGLSGLFLLLSFVTLWLKIDKFQ